ncbi:MAG: SGNH/GDSL hydrolase family protein [Clostridiales bacterium]|nr:SGNH/GDSL hydrolase family protein [Clostridiales bacterium]
MFDSEIHVWGDSIAVGITYSEARKRYVISRERCPKRISEGLNLKVVNNSKMGATVLDGLERFEASEPVEGALCVLEYGGNDCNMDWAKVAENPDAPPQPRVELSVFTKKLEEFIGKIKEKGMKPMLITPLPLHAEKFFNWISQGLDGDAILKAVGEVQNIYGWQERYAIAVRNVAAKTKTPLLDLRDTMLSNKDYPSLICCDGMHLMDEGYRFIGDTLLRRIKSIPGCA